MAELQKTQEQLAAVENGGIAPPGNLAGFHSLEELLAVYVPADKLAEVRRVLYGHNQGGLVRSMELPNELVERAIADTYDLQVTHASSVEPIRCFALLRQRLMAAIRHRHTASWQLPNRCALRASCVWA